jgi:2-(1,2-epoxy-1,2-dihydrophenyl)acetyl-CoA isomerase
VPVCLSRSLASMSEYAAAKGYETVSVYRSGGAVRLELNRPASMNAWNTQFAVDLRSAIEAAAADDDVGAVLINGAGRGFSSGADLKERRDTPEGHPDVYSRLTQLYHPIIMGIREMPKPVIAAVHGAAAGIGCSLALACDLVLAGESAYFVLAFVNIGLVPDGGSSALVPARVGLARAMELAMLGERLHAPKALDWGLINQVWPDAELLSRAEALCARLAEGPTGSYAGAKRMLNRWMYDGIGAQLEAEAQTQQERAASADFAEGVAAFSEKRQPRFTGH